MNSAEKNTSEYGIPLRDSPFGVNDIQYFSFLSEENKEIVAWYVMVKSKALGKEKDNGFISAWRDYIASDPLEDFTDLKELRQAIKDGQIKIKDVYADERNLHSVIRKDISWEEYRTNKNKLNIDGMLKLLRQSEINTKIR